LQRARARLEPLASAADQVTEPTAPEARALLNQYITAFENADATALEHLLRQDATIEMTPFKTWFAGKKTCVAYLTTQVLGSPGDWRMIPTSANGQPTVVAYLRRSDGVHHAFGAAVLTLTATGIARIVVFSDPGLVARFGLPPILSTHRGDR
jgi:RNA polymerase sigma-70 factor (ECF subfamily)